MQQGDPAGPALFAMALSAAVAPIRSEFANTVMDLWYADDGCLIGLYRDVSNAFKILEPTLLSIGLSINHTKCGLCRMETQPNRLATNAL